MSGCPPSAAVLGTQRAEAQLRDVGDSGRAGPPPAGRPSPIRGRHGSGEPIPGPKYVNLTVDFMCVGGVHLVKA